MDRTGAIEQLETFREWANYSRESARTSYKKEKHMEEEVKNQENMVTEVEEASPEQPAILDEITVEEMAVDGICGIY